MEEQKKSGEYYSIGDSIVTPSSRYIAVKFICLDCSYVFDKERKSCPKCRGKNIGDECIHFHSYSTSNCNSIDETGFCRGHKISREDFIEKFCNGILSPQLVTPARLGGK